MDCYLWLFFTICLLRIEAAIAMYDPCLVDETFQKCLYPKARGSVHFEFKPLFPKGVDFVYSFDSETQEDADQQYVPEGSVAAPDSKVAFWLEYPEVNLNPAAHTETYMVVLANENFTGDPSGGNNGCDGLWGAKCSRSLAAWFKAEIAGGAYSPGEAISQLRSYYGGESRTEEGKRILEDTGCPVGFFNETFGYGAFATENGEGSRNTRINASGGPKAAWIVEKISSTGYDEQIKKGVGMFVLQKPLQGDLYKDVKNLQLVMACVKAKRLPEKNSPNQGGDNDMTGNGGSNIPGLHSSGAARPTFSAGLVSLAAVLVWVSS
ncbi:TPA_exp: Uncharacterized protein A8136_2485 [Trichophyton benhamiae CBS 112371]|uniref:Uncharacterized protein n=1 Tax=Arthroderma benhamiae (strain ATCC MYA-4681 / CBS 112371) TaxID=663331 RepID=D4AKH5_ARTBC|nr:uncharacterized protein ARB_04818 [Trichophyton benhamiae CBS 112371]EFE35884.1 conserved hypothetical protein [Trichophyton benhamiae CBS 112371]DAA78700.1 TPA_exp: Uncharacterized protein A8136_2485 [Trichophyton benhamiae CBS 112371]